MNIFIITIYTAVYFLILLAINWILGGTFAFIIALCSFLYMIWWLRNLDDYSENQMVANMGIFLWLAIGSIWILQTQPKDYIEELGGMPTEIEQMSQKQWDDFITNQQENDTN